MEKHGLKIIGSEKAVAPRNGEKNGGVFWKLTRLKNAFHFQMPSAPEVEDLFVEYDELLGVGAYLENGVSNIQQILDQLEELAPGFSGIKLDEKIVLIRHRLSKSPGLSVVNNGSVENFIKDPTLQTINFVDFYFKIQGIEPKIQGENDIQDTERI